MAEVIREKNTRAKNYGYPAEILDVVLQAHGKKVSQVLRDNSESYTELPLCVSLHQNVPASEIRHVSNHQKQCIKILTPKTLCVTSL